MSIYLKILMSFLVSLVASPLWALDLSGEIAELNRDFGRALSYPIAVVDKRNFREFAKSKKVSMKDSKQVAQLLMTYLNEKHLLPVDFLDAQVLVPYVTVLDGNASAIPFFERAYDPKMKFCVVMPSNLDGSAFDETKRMLGGEGVEHLYSGVNVEQLSTLLTVEQFKLVSLYHELSHCMDRRFLPELYQGEPDPHSLHMSETFAEVNALLLLAQRKQLTGVGKGRALLRGTYAKVLGSYFARERMFGDNPLAQFGGSIYFLSRSIDAAELRIPEVLRMRNFEEVSELSQSITLQSAISSRAFRALHFSFERGEEKTIAEYHKLAAEAPDLFQEPYEELLVLLAYLRALSI